MSSAALLNRRYAYADYLGWGDDVRGELIHGVFYDMRPAPSAAHQTVSMELGTQIRSFLRGKRCQVFAAPFDVRLPNSVDAPDARSARDDETDTVVQPDLLVICDPAKLDTRGCRGAPDWVIEILSPATASRDQIEKRALYEHHGVLEYWLVHPVNRIVTVFNLGVESHFGPAAFHEARGTLACCVIDGLAIDWSLVFPQSPGKSRAESLPESLTESSAPP